MWPQYLMVASGILFFVGLVAFLQFNVTAPEAPKVTEAPGVKIGQEPNLDPNARGFFYFSFIRLYDTTELRRKYIFDFLAPTNARMSFYVSPSDLFVFTVADVNNESYALEVPISSEAISLNRYVFLYCEVSLEGGATRLRIVVNGKQVAARTLDFKIELGKDYWKWKHATFGADTNGQNNAPFKIAYMGNGHNPLSDEAIARMKTRFDSFLDAYGNPLQGH